ncbi:hypothetical protein CBS115989_1889 [Aspergillus niger]|nr:hypothetical protein CBS115989_1889 [Aspergillus niger]KAI2856608.1 hypothetical protein CBS11232_3621 [Aspergillus niger]KAI2881330.1 hypothetical protein CBS115988_658 [Aspergillus niger]
MCPDVKATVSHPNKLPAPLLRLQTYFQDSQQTFVVRPLVSRSPDARRIVRLSIALPISTSPGVHLETVSNQYWRNCCGCDSSVSLDWGGSASGPHVEEKERTHPIPDSSLSCHRRLPEPNPASLNLP